MRISQRKCLERVLLLVNLRPAETGLTNSRSELTYTVFNEGKSDVKCSFVHFISHLHLFLIVLCM